MVSLVNKYFSNRELFFNLINNNKQDKSMKKILVIVMLIFAFSCSDDGTKPEPYEIVGKWKSNNTEEGEINQSLLVVEFTKEGKYILSIDIFNPTKALDDGNYTLDNDKITIVSKECENIKGNYRFEFKNNGVEFYLIDDECSRSKSITGFFEKYDAPILK